MQSKSEAKDKVKPKAQNIQPANSYFEPWWRAVEYNSVPPPATVAVGNAPNSSSMECLNNCSESSAGRSISNEEHIDDDDDDDGDKQSQQLADSARSGGGNAQPDAPNGPLGAPSGTTVHGAFVAQPPSLELVGHSIACAPNPYQDPYYGGMMMAYGHQPLSYPPVLGMPHARMPLPHDMIQEPVFVNAKQYQGILRRRQARAKAEVEKKLIKNRKPYLHESRHKHAMRRVRSVGGRFAKKMDVGSGNCTSKEKGADPVPAASSQSACKSSSDLSAADGSERWTALEAQQQAASKPQKYETQNIINHQIQSHNGFFGENGEEGDCSGQELGRISRDKASHSRRLAIQ